MLERIVQENWFKAQATIGFWPADAQGDDILVYADDMGGQPAGLSLEVLASVDVAPAHRSGVNN